MSFPTFVDEEYDASVILFFLLSRLVPTPRRERIGTAAHFETRSPLLAFLTPVNEKDDASVIICFFHSAGLLRRVEAETPEQQRSWKPGVHFRLSRPSLTRRTTLSSPAASFVAWGSEQYTSKPRAYLWPFRPSLTRRTMLSSPSVPPIASGSYAEKGRTRGANALRNSESTFSLPDLRHRLHLP